MSAFCLREDIILVGCPKVGCSVADAKPLLVSACASPLREDQSFIKTVTSVSLSGDCSRFLPSLLAAAVRGVLSLTMFGVAFSRECGEC